MAIWRNGVKDVVLRGQIDEKLERKFREAAMRRFGYGKGALTKALEEAVTRWISAVEEEQLSFEGDPVEAIDGLLSGVEIDAVSLQHEVKKIWASRAIGDVSR